MARLNVSPTRMVLAQLKGRLDTATRGHKLLKDKQDELMRRFIELAKKNRMLRIEVEGELEKAFQAFSMANAVMSPEMLENALLSSDKNIMCDVKTVNVMSVRIPEFMFITDSEEASDFPYGFAQTSAELDIALGRLREVLDKLLELTKVEKGCQLMAEEIEATRRRVNALEYRTIPDLKETIRYIEMKLEEEDRSTITRLLKIKDIISHVEETDEIMIDRYLQTNR